jgi:hypothetical protein
MDRCEECGFSFDSVPRHEIAGRLRALSRRYREVMRLGAVDNTPALDRTGTLDGATTSGCAVRRRPAPDVWSPLEYTCHVRDVFRVQLDRLALALRVDEPMFEPMRRDVRAVEERYNEQDAWVVLDELAAGAEALADAFAALSPSEWLRTGGYVWPNPQSRTMEWIGRNTVHEGEHHLLDIERGLLATTAE